MHSLVVTTAETTLKSDAYPAPEIPSSPELMALRTPHLALTMELGCRNTVKTIPN